MCFISETSKPARDGREGYYTGSIAESEPGTWQVETGFFYATEFIRQPFHQPYARRAVHAIQKQFGFAQALINCHGMLSYKPLAVEFGEVEWVEPRAGRACLAA